MKTNIITCSRFWLLALLLVFTVESHAQRNLVLNPSFESYSTCPNGEAGIQENECNYWSTPNFNTPDYFNYCSTNLISTVPKNLFGYEIPHSGVAYAGFQLNYDNSGVHVREYVQGSLKDSLVSGQTYIVEFYVSNGDSSSGICIDNIGMYFSRDTLYSSTSYSRIAVTPYFQNPVGNWLNVFNGWQKIEGTIIAQGGEQHFSIGNFDWPSGLHYNDCRGLGLNSSVYVYIDDVSVLDTSYTDTLHLCMNDSVHIGERWVSSPGMYYDTVAGIALRKQLLSWPDSSRHVSVDIRIPHDMGDTMIQWIRVVYDTTFSVRYSNINGCDSVVTYVCKRYDGIDGIPHGVDDLSISPNPAHDKLTIQTANFSKSFNWNLYDMQGRFIQSYAITRKEQEIELPIDLNSGMYLWKAYRDGVLLNCGKLLVE